MSSKIKVEVKYPTPDLPATEDEIHKTMTKFIIDTLKTWVLATVDPVPVWSGAARASFLLLAAKAATSFTINPVAPDPPGSRVWLGISEAEADLVIEKGKVYGWFWRSNLAHILIVENRVNFVAAGDAAIQNKEPVLPQPKTKPIQQKK